MCCTISMFRVKQVNKNMTNRRRFRFLARENCGESMEPGETEVMYFGYHPDKKDGDPIACGSLKLAECDWCGSHDKDEYFHMVTFLFVHKDYKYSGFGRQLLSHIEIDAWNNSNRPIRVESAHKSVGFFEKCGYRLIRPPKESVAGSSLFRYLYLMEKEAPLISKEEPWAVD